MTLWFVTVYRELSLKQTSLSDLSEQIHLHEHLLTQAKGTQNEQAAANMLKTSRMLYHEASKGYNSILKKPINRLPALLMGFKKATQ